MSSYDVSGLNLTRATLNAVLKYPWFRQPGGFEKRKYGAYQSEKKAFEWARASQQNDRYKSAEAEVMDWADDIAYSVHDVEDFYQAGLIPLERLQPGSDEIERFIAGAFQRWDREEIKRDYTLSDYRAAFEETIQLFPITEPYIGTKSQRAQTRMFSNFLINRYIDAIQLQKPSQNAPRRVIIDANREMEVAMWKELTWFYVINSPALSAQQRGQKRLIGELFKIFYEDLEDIARDKFDAFPPSYREQLEETKSLGTRLEQKEERVRTVVDFIAGMTEHQTLDLYQKIMGISFGSVLDAII